MKKFQFHSILLAAAALAAVGCDKPKDPVMELQNAAAAMEKQEPAEEAPDPGANVAPTGPPPAQHVKSAIEDYKAGKMEDAVTRLQVLRSMQTLSPQQRMALEDSVAAVMQEIYALAEKGDPRAIAAIQRYQKIQMGGR